jgi:hypothetical protein
MDCAPGLHPVPSMRRPVATTSAGGTRHDTMPADISAPGLRGLFGHFIMHIEHIHTAAVSGDGVIEQGASVRPLD